MENKQMEKLNRTLKDLRYYLDKNKTLAKEVEELGIINDIEVYPLLKDIYKKSSIIEIIYDKLLFAKEILIEPNYKTMNAIYRITMQQIKRTELITEDLIVMIVSLR